MRVITAELRKGSRLTLAVFQGMVFGSTVLLGQTSGSPVSASAQAAPVAPTYTSFTVAIKKSVAYLQTDCLIDGKVVSYSATGFFVMKLDERIGKDRGFGYLVTNRHAAQPGIEHGNPCKVQNYWIRVNLFAPTPADLPQATSISLGPNVPWLFPDDPSVDLAVVSLTPDQSKVDYAPIPSTMFATPDVLKANSIGEGDAIVFTGLFVQMPGLLRLQPIVRQGTIAMIPNEPIMTTLNRPGSLYLADVHVFGGNSGSPMFVNLSGVRNGSLIIGNPNYKLLGVVSGYEFENTDFNLQAATTYSGTVGANSGVTSVVPAGELDKLINAQVLQSQRDAAVARMGK